MTRPTNGDYHRGLVGGIMVYIEIFEVPEKRTYMSFGHESAYIGRLISDIFHLK